MTNNIVLENGTEINGLQLKMVKSLQRSVIAPICSNETNGESEMRYYSNFNLPPDKIFNVVNLVNDGYPILKTFLTASNYKRFGELMEIFDNDIKRFTKYLGLFKNDADEAELCHTVPNHFNLLKLLGPERMTKLMTKVNMKGLKTIEDEHGKKKNVVDNENGLSIHDFVANLFKPNEFDSDPDGLLDFLMSILDYSQQDLFSIMPFANYKKVRNAVNKKAMLKHIEFVKAARGGYTSSEYIENDMGIANVELTDNRFLLSKDPAIVNSIGAETNCCFRPGGIAGKLLVPANKSPLSAIIHGTFRTPRARWFSFIWDYVEKVDEEYSSFTKHLVLDNIEANAMIKDENAEYVRDTLLNSVLPNYKSIKLGYSRNDIDKNVLLSDQSQVEKRTHLIGYESSFSSVYDDSKYMHTVGTNDTVEMNAKVTRMNKGDFLRALYMEKEIYGAKSDYSDLSKIDIYNSPNYIIQSDTHVFGYFITQIKYYKQDETNFNFGKELSSAEINRIKYNNYNDGKDIDEGLKPVLFIEDIFIQRYKHVMKSLRFIKDDLLQWCKDNKIEIVTACTNEFSRPFTNTLVNNDEGVSYIEIDPPGAEHIRSFDTEKFVKVDPRIKVIGLDVDMKDLSPVKAEDDEEGDVDEVQEDNE